MRAVIPSTLHFYLLQTNANSQEHIILRITSRNVRALVADVVVTTLYSPTQHYLYIFSATAMYEYLFVL